VSLQELQALERRYVIPVYERLPVEFVRAEGTRLWDDAGKEYLDFFTGFSVHNVGQCHPRIVAAIREQAGRLGAV
jgi:acetylornithine/N-succinyldiaminopimelate aminotransferase